MPLLHISPGFAELFAKEKRTMSQHIMHVEDVLVAPLKIRVEHDSHCRSSKRSEVFSRLEDGIVHLIVVCDTCGPCVVIATPESNDDLRSGIPADATLLAQVPSTR